MKLDLTIKGKLMEVKLTKTNKPYAVVYSDGDLIRVFDVQEGLKARIGQEVSIKCSGFAKEAYLKQEF